ncbi:MAG: PIN domain-containing protein [Pseudonocardia sp.]|nr:PIN domain-containing protein [Pseudonocardia sp.]MBO0872653.1 PIN domain-containing protein [Pseudonocardia sp.]
MGTLRALADTSVLVGLEQGRVQPRKLPPLTVSTVTIGELRFGLLAAREDAIRAVRLRTLQDALKLDPLPVDEQVTDAWSEMRVALRTAGRCLAANDSWIAATAIAHDLPLVTQDRDYDGVPGLDVVKL